MAHDTVAQSARRRLPRLMMTLVLLGASMFAATVADVTAAPEARAAESAFTPPGYGIVDTLAGTGAVGCGGDGGPAANATFTTLEDVEVASNGDIYIADSGCHVVRRIDIETGIISTVAGTSGVSGSTGDGGLATQARFVTPTRIAVDSSGSIFVVDRNGRTCQDFCGLIRKVDGETGIISTIVGQGPDELDNYEFAAGDVASEKLLDIPGGLVLDGQGGLYFSGGWVNDSQGQAGQQLVRLNISTGVITSAAFVQYSGPIALGSDGSVYLGHDYWAEIWKVDPSTGSKTRLYQNINVSGGQGIDGLTVANGQLFATDRDANKLIDVDLGTGATYEIGTGIQGFSGDGTAAVGASFQELAGVAVDADGNLIVADAGNNRIRWIGDAIHGSTPSINGIVTDSNANPVPGATVTAMSGDTGEVASSTTSAADGSYSLSVPQTSGTNVAGYYKLSFQADGYISGYYGDGGSLASDYWAAASVETSWGTPQQNIDGALQQAGVLQGRVTDAISGEPLANICEYLYGNEGQPAGFGTCTNANGDYAMPVAPGTYSVAFFDPAGVYPTIRTTGVTVAAGQTTTADRVLTAPAGTVAGTVTDATTGTPLFNVCVTLWDGSAAVAGTCTNSDGRYAITGPAPGSFTLSFTDMTGIHTTQWNGGAATQAGSMSITIGAQAVIADMAMAQPNGSISGSIRYPFGSYQSPLVCVYLYHSGQNGEYAGKSTCGNQRFHEYAGPGVADDFRIDDVDPGVYVLAYVDTTGVAPVRWSSPYGVLNQSEAVDFTVRPDMPTQVESFWYHSAEPRSASGRITDQTGKGLDNICVIAYDSQGLADASYQMSRINPMWATCTNANGVFSITDIQTNSIDAQQRWSIAMFDPTANYPTQWARVVGLYCGGFCFTSLVSVSTPPSPGDGIPANPKVSGPIFLSISKGGTISGMVENSDGTPKVNACVYANFAGNGNYVGQGAVTDTNGNYILVNLAPDDLNSPALRGYKIGFYENCDAGQPPTTHWNGGASSEAAAPPIYVNAGQDTGGVNAQF